MPIDKISGVAFTAINKLSGIAKASIANVSGVSTAAASNVEFFVDASDSSSYSGSGTTWSDLSGNGYDLTLTNGPAYNSGSIDSFSFDGSNDYAQNGNGLQIFGASDAYTTEVWMRLTSAFSIRSMIGKRESSNSANGWVIAFRSGSTYNGLLWRSTSPSGFIDVVFSSNQTSTLLNSWCLLTCVKNSDGSFAVYINGVAKASQVASHSSLSNLAFDMNNSSAALALGRYGTSGSFEFRGGIGQAKIHSEALTASAALASFNADKTKYGY
tara:strand:- start:1563 stop:2372 length:810 start_codon:yes stop_codon:yes gene_type:complete